MPDTAAPPAGRKGNVLTRKIGPLPTWGWVAIVLTPILIYAVIERKKAAAASTASTTGTDTTGGSAMTDASQIPQFVNQTYTTVIPPAAPGSLPPPTTLVPPITNTPIADEDGGGGGGTPGPVHRPPFVGQGLYWHSSPGGGKTPYFTLNGRTAPESSGKYQIAGKTYYFHASPKGGAKSYFTLNGKKASPPSGAAVKG